MGATADVAVPRDETRPEAGARAPQVTFLGLDFRGHRTRFMNPRRHAEPAPRIAADLRWVGSWSDVGDIGAAREIVADGETGWVVEPTGGRPATVLDQAVRDRPPLGTVGRLARAVAEAPFDGARDDRQVVDLLLKPHEQRTVARRPIA